MNSRIPRRFVSATIATLTLGTGSAFAQSIIYRETFSSTVNNNNLTQPGTGWNGGWSLHRSTTAGGTVNNASSTAAVVSNATGRPSNLSPINAGTYGQDATGLLFAASGDMREALFFTSEYTFASNTLGSVSWYMGNGNASVEQRAALQVGTQWYVSAAVSGSNIGGAANFASQATEQTVANSGAVWFTLNYTLASSGFSIGGTAVSLPAGTVNAMGILADTKSLGNSRIDTFTITTAAIPEPSSFAALAGLATLGFVASRRRPS